MPVLLPTSLRAACDMLAEHAGAIPLAGGTDLLVHWPEHVEHHSRTYLDLSHLAELKPIRWTDEALVLGALTTYWDVQEDEEARTRFPLLAAAAGEIGGVQIQTRGTWAGNIVNASPAADGVPVLMAYDARVELASRTGTEEIPLSEFYEGYKQIRRRSDQLVTAIRIPRRDYSFQFFEKVGPRRAQAIAKVGVAITKSGRNWRVVVSSMAPTVCRCPAIESRLGAPTRVAAPDDFLPAIRADLSPIDDLRSTARYREQTLARVLFYARS